jgi:hypothetical protein
MPSGSADMMLIIAVFKHAHSRLNVGTSKIGVCGAEFEPNTHKEDLEEGRN